MYYSRGFTLIEVLVVVAVVAIMASLLLPALSRAKSSARRIQCLNQLRQLNLGISYYVLEHEQGFPHRGQGNDWLAAISKNLSPSDSLLICPEDKRKLGKLEKKNAKPDQPLPPKWMLRSKERSYVINGFSDAHFEATGDYLWKEESVIIKENQILHPSTTILLGEKNRDMPLMWLDVLPLGTDFLSLLTEGRHMSGKGPEGYIQGSANYAFVDGHLEDIKFGKATCPINYWCITDRWRTHAALCSPRVFSK